jgi:hypothetical protein
MFDQSRFRDLNEYNEYLTRKLKHYNEWLMNPKRSLIAGAYPGFPEDVSYREIIQGMREDFQERRVVAEKQHEEKKLDKQKKPRAKKIEGPSRLVQAQEIYKRLNGDRAAVVQAIQDELEMPASSAMTYFYNSKKALGI